MKKLLPLILFLFPLLAYAGTTVVSVTPEITNKTEYPPIHRTPPKMPVVTITDNTILRVENITQYFEILYPCEPVARLNARGLDIQPLDGLEILPVNDSDKQFNALEK
ncbi:MAG: hypothetical protein K2F94_01370 [Muribaculaceae bacterium]|nr:hypothetical protein [Muribaculaceae bacterium]